MCFEFSSHLKDFCIKSVDYPFHIGFKILLPVKSAYIYIYLYLFIYMLAFCCGDPTLRTSHIEPRLNIDSTTLWCWCTWRFQMCFELGSHLKDFCIKSVDYPFHMGSQSDSNTLARIALHHVAVRSMVLLCITCVLVAQWSKLQNVVACFNA